MCQITPRVAIILKIDMGVAWGHRAELPGVSLPFNRAVGWCGEYDLFLNHSFVAAGWLTSCGCDICGLALL